MTEKPTQLQEFIDSLSDSTRLQCRKDLTDQISAGLLDGFTDDDFEGMILLGRLAEFVQILDAGIYEDEKA